MTKYRILSLAVAVAWTLACFGGGEVSTAEADSQLKSGNLPGAAGAYDGLAAENPDSPAVAVGQSFMQMLQGDYDAADKTLQGAEEKAGDKVGEIKLRRALVALRAGNLDDVKKHGKDSGLPAGKVLAAEVHLADAEVDDAIALLKDARDAGGAVGDAATTYLDMLESGDAFQAGLAEATALWAVGQRAVACEVAEEIVKALPDDGNKGATLLLWAGRAVTSGRPGIATNLLDEMDQVGSPEGQEWRVQATRAMVEISEGQTEEGLARFASLEMAIQAGFAPYEGVADARATAAALASDKAIAKQLVEGLEGVAPSRGLYQAGAGKVARDLAPSGSTWATFLDGK